MHWRLHSCVSWEAGVGKVFPAQDWEGLHSPAVCDTEPALLPFHAARAQGQVLLTGAFSLAFLPLPRALGASQRGLWSGRLGEGLLSTG